MIIGRTLWHAFVISVFVLNQLQTGISTKNCVSLITYISFFITDEKKDYVPSKSDNRENHKNWHAVELQKSKIGRVKTLDNLLWRGVIYSSPSLPWTLWLCLISAAFISWKSPCIRGVVQPLEGYLGSTSVTYSRLQDCLPACLRYTNMQHSCFFSSLDYYLIDKIDN